MEEPVVLPAGQARVFRRFSRCKGGTEAPESLAASLRAGAANWAFLLSVETFRIFYGTVRCGRRYRPASAFR